MALSSNAQNFGSEPLLNLEGIERPRRGRRDDLDFQPNEGSLSAPPRIPLRVLASHVLTGFRRLAADERGHGRSRRLRNSGSHTVSPEIEDGSQDMAPATMPMASPLQFMFASICNRVTVYATACATFVSICMFIFVYWPHRRRPALQIIVCFTLMLSSFAMLLDVIIGRGSRLLALYPRISLLRVLLLNPSSILLCVLTKDVGLFIAYAAVQISTVCWILRQWRANRAQNEVAAADSNPTEWIGVDEVVAGVSSGGAISSMKCARCESPIDGACCYARGTRMHFGCADEDTQNVCAHITEEAQSCGTMLDSFYASVLSGEAIYRFRLDVEKVFAVKNPGLELAFEDSKNRLDPENQNIKQLYHGTPYANVKSILDSGFKLPGWAGMFGYGIYFAEVPQKSWSFGNHYVIVCDVLLGRQCRLEDAAPNFKPNEDIDSVVGLRRAEGGVLRETEYVVYKPSQIVPRYLLQLKITFVGDR